jgi:hypothetical protein
VHGFPVNPAFPDFFPQLDVQVPHRSFKIYGLFTDGFRTGFEHLHPFGVVIGSKTRDVALVDYDE